jgi:hypothetical protein
MASSGCKRTSLEAAAGALGLRHRRFATSDEPNPVATPLARTSEGALDQNIHIAPESRRRATEGPPARRRHRVSRLRERGDSAPPGKLGMPSAL